MNQFFMSTPTNPPSQLKTGADGPDVGALKIHSAKLYSARLEMLGNQLSLNTRGGQSIQVKVAVGQQTVTVPIPVGQQIPAAIKAGQSFQVSFSTNKDGQPQISFYPQDGAKAAAQTVKISLSDAQLVNLLTLSKAFRANPDGSVQTQAKIVLNNQNIPALKLPGLASAIKLPEGVADLLKDSKSVNVTIDAKSGKIELQLSLDGKAAKITLPLTADKVSQMVRQAVNQSPNLAMKVEAQTAGATKTAGAMQIALPNQQKLTLPGKTDPDAQVKIQSLSQREMSVKITGSATSNTEQSPAKPLLSILLNRPLAGLTTAQPPAGKGDAAQGAATSALSKAAASLKPMMESLVQSVKFSTTTADNTTQLNPLSPQASAVDLKQQKQVLDKLIDPLIRLLLPKKVNWSEGLKSLATLEQQLPDAKATAEGDKVPQLKQLLNQLNRAIPDQNSALTEKNIANIVGQLINFNPAKVSTSIQPTPANAIASALQLLLGSKLVHQNEAKSTPQLIKQLASLLTPLTGKEAKTAKEMKALTGPIVQAEQGSNSLKTLVGLQSGIRHQQLENAEKKVDGNTQINLSIPLKIDDEFKEVKIAITEEEAKKGQGRQKNSIWQLNLTFDLNEMGRLLVNAKLKDGEVSMHLYAEKQKTLTLMEKFSAILEKRLETQGVKINNIQSSLGKINTPKDNKPMSSILQITV
ncbi:MAG: hypothetical protein ACI8WB_002662 [Phenylobacterium sp.]|jgi:hypothetical protein